MSQPQHIAALTGIRAIAAGMVFYGHMLNGHLPEIPIFLQYGWTGVNVFFALSGYLFTYLYADRLIDGTFSWKDYIKRRLIRIYPLTTLLIAIAVCSRWGEFSYENIVLHLLLLQAWVPDYRLSLISPMWTLTVEESYYFSAPFLIYYISKLFGDRSTRDTARSKQVKAWRIIALAIVVWIVALAFANGATDLYQDIVVYGTLYWDSGAWTFTIFSRIIDFVSGMLAATVARHILPQKKYWGDFIVLVGVVLFWNAISVATDLGGPNHVGDHRLGIFIQKSIGLSAAVVIYGLHVGGLASRLLSTKVLVLLGEASFALYLIQLMPFIWWPEVGMQIQYNLEDLGINYYVAATASYVTMNVVAVSIYYAFERPVSRYLRKRYLAAR
ncbi:MAG: acyltransferase [Ignavibacteria bacterium]|nr:acyltransferase [Ignavibacteria bacterium]